MADFGFSSSTGNVYQFDAKSTYIQEPPFFANFSMSPGTISEIKPVSAGAKDIPSDDFYIVIDRMAFNPDDEGRIADFTLYCTGDWDEARVTEHARAVRLLRP